MELKTASALLLATASIVACGVASGNVDELEGTPTIRYYQTPTVTSTSTQTTSMAASTNEPQPTSTPFIYKIVADDTMLDIATRFGVTLEDLMAVNPAVDPNFLIVGTDLIIPVEGAEGSSVFPITAPLPLDELELQCYSDATGGLWCFWLVGNAQEQGVENLSANITLYDSEGEEVASQEAIGPLNVLWPGEQFPLAAYFDPPLDDWLEAHAQLLTSLPVAIDDDRYLAAEVSDKDLTVTADGLAAKVSGVIRLLDAEKEAGLVWVLAVAYDQDGHVVGVRRWENEQGIKAGKKSDFEMNVYSMGPVITDVHVFVEARP